VVGAFHHVSCSSLWKSDGLEHEDIPVCGDDAEAKARVMDLAAAVSGHAGVDAGPLRMARQLEPLTAVLINVNKRYKVRSGRAVTGLPRAGH
jgi:predicted dinucleotide-binding enzyme